MIPTTTASLYPPNWPATPFHSGELQLQERFGVREKVNSYAPKVVRPFMPDQHRHFFTDLPFVVVAARDEQGSMWSTLLADPKGGTGFITSPSPTTLSLHTQPMTGDALEHAFDRPGVDIGMLGIEFATKRRNRVNGRTTTESNKSAIIEFRVDQSFGNCPQYITPRRWWSAVNESYGEQSPHRRQVESQRSNSLSSTQIEQIRSSDTLFIATGYRGKGEDPRWGNDASHRGGSPGWIKVRDSHTILLPDYAGNDHYNTLGNIEMDPRMGLTIPVFATGGMIQLTGTAKVHYDEEQARLLTNDTGAKRAIEFTIHQVNELPPGSLPIRWASYDTKRSKRTLQVAHKIKESNDVTSFHLHPLLGDDPELWSYEPGQHLPITLSSTDQQEISRTYSLSSGPDWGEYRISVKREPFGQASRYLHDHVQVGDKIQVSQPAGDFVLDQDSNRTLVLISGGVGVTPMLSMLHSFVASDSRRRRKAVWVHGARDGKHHPFRGEVQDLKLLAGDSLLTHVVYSRPTPQDDDGSYDTTGHVDATLLQKLVPDLTDADFYMCGSSAFMADIQDGLEKFGVDPNRIQYEQF